MLNLQTPGLRLLVWGGGLLAIAYAAACFFLWWSQTRFIFFPSSVVDITPAEFNLAYEDVWIPVATGAGQKEKVHGWWIPATQPTGRVLLYLHGNGINIGANAAHAARFQRMGFSVLLIDYRGYGKSQGSFPSEQRVYADAEAAWQYLTQDRQISPREIVIYGHSLGGAIAIDLAVRQPQAAGVIVESSFTSIRDMVNQGGRFRLFPVDLLLHQQFDSIAKVPHLQMPILLIHGEQDGDVPATLSQRLYDAAPEPKQLWLVPEAGHNNVADRSGVEYFQVVQQFIQRVYRHSPDPIGSSSLLN